MNLSLIWIASIHGETRWERNKQLNVSVDRILWSRSKERYSKGVGFLIDDFSMNLSNIIFQFPRRTELASHPGRSSETPENTAGWKSDHWLGVRIRKDYQIKRWMLTASIDLDDEGVPVIASWMNRMAQEVKR